MTLLPPYTGEPRQPGELDLSAGLYLKGIPLATNSFLAATTLSQLRQITRDPRDLQVTGRRRGVDDLELQLQRDLHDLVQRAIAGTKRTNVPKYRRYIEDIADGGRGVLPPIHPWSRDLLDVAGYGTNTYALVPNGEYLLSIDGETQLTGHWDVARGVDIAPETKRRHSKLPLGIVVHHGIDTQTARQYFHDLNILAVRPNIGIGLSRTRRTRSWASSPMSRARPG